MNIPQKWLNTGQQSIRENLKLRRNIAKVIWIKMLILMLLAKVRDVMPKAFEIPLMFPRTKSQRKGGERIFRNTSMLKIY